MYYIFVGWSVAFQNDQIAYIVHRVICVCTHHPNNATSTNMAVNSYIPCTPQHLMSFISRTH